MSQHKYILSAFFIVIIILLLNQNSLSAQETFEKISQKYKSNSFVQTVLKRQSIRKFTIQKVSDSIVNDILYLTNRAPSAGNLQAYKIYVVKNKELISKLAEASNGQYAVQSSQQLFVFVALPEVSAIKYKDRGRKLYALQDATIAAAYSQLIIQNFNLYSVWIGSFSPVKVSALLKLNKNELPVAIIPFGYAGEKKPSISPRKPLNKLVTYIK